MSSISRKESFDKGREDQSFTEMDPKAYSLDNNHEDDHQKVHHQENMAEENPFRMF